MQVANCYVRLKYRRLEKKEFDRYSERLLREATELTGRLRRGQYLDYSFEEGSLIQRIIVIGTLTLGAISQYHKLRESIIDIAHDANTLSTLAIDKFHEITGASPDDHIYTRKASRDVNRLNRIVAAFDHVATENVSAAELHEIRNRVVHDLAGLARANPNDPEIAKLMQLLPKKRIPDLPSTPREALRIDEADARHKKRPADELEDVTKISVRRPRRRYHTRVPIRPKR